MTTQSPFLLPYDKRWAPDQIQECIQLFQLTPIQQAQLLELKERLSDVSYYWANGPFELARFVLEHTCHGNIHTMERRFRKCMEWRQDHGIDTILETYAPPKLMYRYPMAIMHDTDRDGDLIVVGRLGDVRGLIQRYGVDGVIQWLFWRHEFTGRGPWQRDFVQKHGNRPRLRTAVLDLKGLNSRHFHPSLLLLAQKIGGAIQLHYPHIVKKLLIVNAPFLFQHLWSIFKPLVFPHLRAKMEIAAEKDTEALLNKYIDLEVLPGFLVPGKAKGKPVAGLDPNWDISILPPPSPSDSKRIPLVYPPYGKNDKPVLQHQDTASTCTSIDSIVSMKSVHWEDHHNALEEGSVCGRILLKGTWVNKKGVASVALF